MIDDDRFKFRIKKGSSYKRIKLDEKVKEKLRALGYIK